MHPRRAARNEHGKLRNDVKTFVELQLFAVQRLDFMHMHNRYASLGLKSLGLVVELPSRLFHSVEQQTLQQEDYVEEIYIQIRFK